MGKACSETAHAMPDPGERAAVNARIARWKYRLRARGLPRFHYLFKRDW